MPFITLCLERGRQRRDLEVNNISCGAIIAVEYRMFLEEKLHI